jgi:transcriptional regulator with XRE-family HTH domain
MGVNTALPSAMWLPFGARVLRARSDRGLSRAELARNVGVTDDKLRAVEDAHCRPARSLVERVDTALGTEHQLVDAWAITLQAEAFPSEFGDMSELVGPCVFLASRGSNLVTGISLLVDGGWYAG